MMKGVAVPYIIAILLGVGVIGLVGYWLFVSGGQFGGTSASQTCKSNLSVWCSQWALTGYSVDWITTGNDGSFNTKYSNCPGLITDKDSPTADDVGAAKSKCTQ